MTRRPIIYRRGYIPQRRLVFVGGEGASEVAYVGHLQYLARVAGLPVHIEISDLGRGAGDPLARIRLAVQQLDRLARTRIEPPDRFVMLDRDQAEREPAGAERARRLAEERRITIVWQDPCFEALLLRHMPSCATLLPPDNVEALRVLRRHWPEYTKPMSSIALRHQLDVDSLRRAADVEPDLAQLLRCLGLL